MTAPATAVTRPPASAASASASAARSVARLARARVLQAQSRQVHPVVAAAYRRRAAELRLEAWLLAVKSSPPPDIDGFTTRAA